MVQLTKKIIAMDEYAQDQVNGFIEWTIKNKWGLGEDRIWRNFGIHITEQVELTFRQLYNLYKPQFNNE